MNILILIFNLSIIYTVLCVKLDAIPLNIINDINKLTEHAKDVALTNIAKFGFYDEKRTILTFTGKFIITEDAITNNPTIYVNTFAKFTDSINNPINSPMSNPFKSLNIVNGLPILHSAPGAAHTIYLNFLGGIIVGTAWNAVYNLPQINAKPYSIDSNPRYFKFGNRSNI